MDYKEKIRQQIREAVDGVNDVWLLGQILKAIKNILK